MITGSQNEIQIVAFVYVMSNTSYHFIFRKEQILLDMSASGVFSVCCCNLVESSLPTRIAAEVMPPFDITSVAVLTVENQPDNQMCAWLTSQ